jgi:hypothetical protein
MDTPEPTLRQATGSARAKPIAPITFRIGAMMARIQEGSLEEQHPSEKAP